ncbi:MAG TPA: hypothetical protein PKM65_12220 [Spirochaetota bacterium]|nr:hypothetical protein [Spirochaetota bacterium]HNT09565.1 hypothetical protein [Spirochaetota bacterium]HNV45609.1 hypothetical protein [Spirochaetota bacterium]HOS40146.1 hypothetical protein [Spirochaetota bacterium]HPU87640.1 hypothetical protein [Spirochaetota bacterium]
MNIKKYLLASVAVYVAFQAIDFVFHGIIMADTYKALSHLWRSDMMSYMWIMYLAGVVLAGAFTYIFVKGYEGKGLLEGVRFGIVAGLFMNVMGMFGQYAMYPVPFSLTLIWFGYGMAQYVIGGVIAAAIYRPE